MTVCVAALASEGKAIVLVSDKALTYGDNRFRPAVQGDSGGVEKLLVIGDSGWHSLMAGAPIVAESVIRLVEDQLSIYPDIAKNYGKMMDCAKIAYQRVREQAVVDQVLQPLLLTKETFITRANNLLPLQDKFFSDVAESVWKFSADCEMLICGFDGDGTGRIFTVTNPGQVISHNVDDFGAIGVGAETATARLLWNAAEREDDLDLALYQAFEAKAYAETIQGVGTESDVWIMVPGGIQKVPGHLLALLASVFAYSAQMPFRARKGWNPAPPPPKNWEAMLRRFTKSILKKQPALRPEPDSNAP